MNTYYDHEMVIQHITDEVLHTFYKQMNSLCLGVLSVQSILLLVWLANEISNTALTKCSIGSVLLIALIGLIMWQVTRRVKRMINENIKRLDDRPPTTPMQRRILKAMEIYKLNPAA